MTTTTLIHMNAGPEPLTTDVFTGQKPPFGVIRCGEIKIFLDRQSIQDFRAALQELENKLKGL